MRSLKLATHTTSHEGMHSKDRREKKVVILYILLTESQHVTGAHAILFLAVVDKAAPFWEKKISAANPSTLTLRSNGVVQGNDSSTKSNGENLLGKDAICYASATGS
jgi:hypothetical protein